MDVQRRRTAGTAGILALALSLAAGCGSAPAASTTHTVSFVVANNQLNFAIEMMHGFRTGVNQVPGVTQVALGPPTVDGPGELRMFESLPKNRRDGVSVFTLAPELFAGPLAATVAKGVPVIAVDNPPGPGANVPLFVGNDNYLLGRTLADEVIKRLPAGAAGTIVLGTTMPGVPVLDLRAKGMRDEIRARLPRVTVRGPFDTKQDVVANQAAWQILVTANPKAMAFLGTGDADGWNLAAIREKTHGTWLAGAFDLDPRALAAVKRGDLLLMSPEHFIKGAIAGRLQAEHAKHGTALPTGWIVTPGLAVTPANVDAIIARQSSVAAREAWFTPIVDDIVQHERDHLRPMPSI